MNFQNYWGVTPQTLRNWDRLNKLKPHHTSSNGYRYYSDEQLTQVTGAKPVTEKKIIGYCRVGSKKQKADLDKQMEQVRIYLLSQGRPF